MKQENKNHSLIDGLFVATALIQRNGLVGALLYPQMYPYLCCQAIVVKDEEEAQRLIQQFSRRNLPVYRPNDGNRTILVVQTSGTSPTFGAPEITQENHAEVYAMAKRLFQTAADWCSKHPEVFSTSPMAIPLSL